MSTVAAYFLRFRSPLHIGERGVGLEETHHHVPADTLFGALCTAWRWLYGASSLQNDLLAPFVSAPKPPFVLTSAFPFAGEVLFYPKPLGQWRGVSVQSAQEKSLKRVQWVSQSILERWLNGESLEFTSQHCIAGGTAWVTPDEARHLQSFTDDETGEVVLWRSSVVPRVTLDRVTSASQIWFFGQVAFVSGAGLWCAIRYADESLRVRVEACLRVLGDSGLGGERSAGLGLFEVESARTVTLPGSASASYCMTLSPFCPTEQQLADLIDDRLAYDVLARRGWVGSLEGGSLRRKLVYMLTEGSVFRCDPETPLGRLVDVTPDGCPHPVWRYGYAFPLGVSQT